MGRCSAHWDLDLLLSRIGFSDQSPGYGGSGRITVCDNRIRNALFGRKPDSNIRLGSHRRAGADYENKLN